MHTADPVVHSFKSTADIIKMHRLGAFMASAADKGDILKDETARNRLLNRAEKQPQPDERRPDFFKRFWRREPRGGGSPPRLW
ncbi:MAG: hypothetical protein CVU55_12270 [Deltaproteobacteria bacterium HGW-Deltaproteobacteria-13]|nr:MAG: hypothetical protein CVU55_12270 [Deltaproteobacteria bacterium HGW-Deltaproteobacteria-13]